MTDPALLKATLDRIDSNFALASQHLHVMRFPDALKEYRVAQLKAANAAAQRACNLLISLLIEEDV